MPDGRSVQDPQPDEYRVLLVKPGDVLLIGSIGDELNADPDVVQQLGSWLNSVGIRFAAFAGDISLDMIPADWTAMAKAGRHR